VPKPKYRVRLLTAAEQDFKEIIDYILADNAAVALSIADKIETNLNLLENNPQLGRIPNDDELLRLGYRYLIALDYLIFYKIEGNTIFVYRILHGARNYKSLL
jgi:plasmid stabilization system protein ParE